MKTSVTVLGLGAMGTALARAFLAAGHPTTVWNRTPGRSPELDGLGAVRAATLTDAIAANGLVIVCLLDYASVHEAIDDAGLTEKVLVNLTNGTPAQARSTADWAERLGAQYIDGGIMAVPAMIGGPAASVLYSGSSTAFEQHQHGLAVLGRATYLGADPGLAPLHDIALLSAMYGLFGGALQAYALIGSEQLSPTAFTTDLLLPWLTAMLTSLPRMANDLEYGAQPGAAGSNLAMQATGFANLIQAAEDQAVSPEILLPIQELLKRAVAAGAGDEDLAALLPHLTR
ncbi:NAD(P)-dependent oxidoreductase [Kribbella qitaiheensis]|uniref:NAD(P)-dependent oxidoreductase n=1 Tax=Kribbella qitaiheensis TaxID=1544730 RepID=A0A7G6WYE5_9ACTN|nr:NAD(P)-binding domain-containing protein [Kribbella qitaiheensis]QNE19010.1 NAD(P)-dependent oxidoreductase [Kribbella qitaiheensis]